MLFLSNLYISYAYLHRIKELEERKSIVDKSTQTTETEAADTKEESGKEVNAVTQNKNEQWPEMF